MGCLLSKMFGCCLDREKPRLKEMVEIIETASMEEYEKLFKYYDFHRNTFCC